MKFGYFVLYEAVYTEDHDFIFFQNFQIEKNSMNISHLEITQTNYLYT